MPVPVISFDNVLPALAMVLTAWGLRLRDGLVEAGMNDGWGESFEKLDAVLETP